MYESNTKVKTVIKQKPIIQEKSTELKESKQKEQEPVEVPEFRKPFKTVMCYRYEQYGKCPYDKTCTYAHGKKELDKHVSQHQAHLKNYYQKFNEKMQKPTPSPPAPVASKIVVVEKEKEKVKVVKEEEPAEEEYYDEEYDEEEVDEQNSGWNKNLYKTEMCRNILKTGKCPYNPCYFAHSEKDKRDPRLAHLYYQD